MKTLTCLLLAIGLLPALVCAQDWANLDRYRADNAKLGPPASGENRVVFMGDSITDAWGRSYGKFFPGKPYVKIGRAHV